MLDNGWSRSADAWIAFIDQGDGNREAVLDPCVLDLCGDVRGKDVLDVGCGEGRFCRMLSQRGARTTGIDPTPELLAAARERHREGHYVEAMAESLPFEPERFDVVVSYVTLVDIPDYRTAIAEMARVLKPGGRLVIANLQSFASTSPMGWYRGPEGEKLHFPVDNYAEEWSTTVHWRGIDIVNWHRPLSDYMAALLGVGLRLTRFEEPVPSAEALARFPAFEDFLRVPTFLAMLWEKPK